MSAKKRTWPIRLLARIRVAHSLISVIGHNPTSHSI
jgi:hypothetical protein